MPNQKTPLSKRFRGFLPVVMDVETGGFNARTDALLEIASIIIRMDDESQLQLGHKESYHVVPFPGANCDEAALEFNKIDPHHPFRFAVSEEQALTNIFDSIRKSLKETGCHRAVLVGHNAWFDLSFINAVVKRCQIKKNPLHAFTSLDTASLSALVFGQTVLSRSVKAAGLPFDVNEAHSAIYDAERTAELFCYIVNRHPPLTLK